VTAGSIQLLADSFDCLYRPVRIPLEDGVSSIQGKLSIGGRLDSIPANDKILDKTLFGRHPLRCSAALAAFIESGWLRGLLGSVLFLLGFHTHDFTSTVLPTQLLVKPALEGSSLQHQLTILLDNEMRSVSQRMNKAGIRMTMFAHLDATALE
jgi:hypothetical protein